MSSAEGEVIGGEEGREERREHTTLDSAPRRGTEVVDQAAQPDCLPFVLREASRSHCR